MVTLQQNPNETSSSVVYTANGQTLQILHLGPEGEIDQAFYAYDPAENRSYLQTAEGFATYSYDPLNQLLSEDHWWAGLRTWSYDAARHRVTEAAPDGATTWSYDPADQLLATAGPDGVTSYSYDGNGARLLTQPPRGAATSYAWNAQQRVSEIALPTGAILTQAYRQDNLRHQRSGDNGPEVVIWDGNDPRLWVGHGAGPVQLFVPGPAFVNRAVGVDGAGNPVSRQYHEDAFGSVQATTNDSGTVETSYVIDAWGNVLSGSTADNPLDYVGGQSYWAENGAGLRYVRQRWLDAQTAGWLSVDPESGEPRYSYVRNAPTQMVDPTGRESVPDESSPIAAMPDPSRDYQALSRRGGVSIPVSKMTRLDKIAETIIRAIKLVPGETGDILWSMLSWKTLGIVAGTILFWGLSHLVGVGEFIDAVLLIVGFTMLGASVVQGVEEISEWAKGAVNAKTDEDLDRAAQHCAKGVSILGIDVIQAILLHKSLKDIQARPGRFVDRIRPRGLEKVGPPPGPNEPLTIKRVPSLGSRVAGVTDDYGNIKIATRYPLETQRIALYHELVHRFFSPKAAPLRQLRAQFAASGYWRSGPLTVLLEEAMAEFYGQLKVRGLGDAFSAIKFPVGPVYITIGAMASEGIAIGSITVGGARFGVYLKRGRFSMSSP